MSQVNRFEDKGEAEEKTKDHFVSALEKVVKIAVVGQQAAFFERSFGQADVKTEFMRLLPGPVYDLKGGEAA